MARPSVIKKVFSLVIGYSIAICYGVCFVYRILKRWIRDPSDRFWKVKTREIPPECLQNPAFGSHSYIRTKNVKLHYVHKGDQSKPLMVLLHGFPEFWYSWRHQLVEFSLDYWVVAVDMRGYGDSDKPTDRSQYTMQYLAEDIKDLIKALGREQCTLVAHDWGGIVAWFLVLLEPQLFDSYVIMNSAHPIAFRNVLNKNRTQFRKSWYVFFFQLLYLPELMCRMDDMAFLVKAFHSDKSPVPITEEDIEAYKFIFGKPGAFTSPINYYRANFMLESRNRLQDLSKNSELPPGLILFGEKDLYIDKDIQEESVRLVANTRVVYVKDANHFVQQDDPTTVNAEMRKFFSELKNKEK